MRSLKGLGIVALYAALFTGCARWLPAPTPLRTVASRAHLESNGRCLLVLLPGLGDSENDFVDRGFVAAVHARNLDVDTIAANATLGYYAKQTLVDRVRTDILEPARAKGYAQIWIAGISMGGLGALLTAKAEKDITGVVLIAPYLGTDDVQKEIAAAGGVARWQPAPPPPNEDYNRELWRWLKATTEKPDSTPSIYLAAGDEDRLSAGHKLLSAVLPAERVFRTKGKHDWGPWSVLWADFLDRSDFRARCTAQR